MPAYAFRPVTPDDFDLLHAWHREPHVAAWWGGTRYTSEHLRDSRLTMRIVEIDGDPFAFVQDYDVHGWEGHHFAHLPPGSRGMDQFIGTPGLIDRGHGSAFITARMNGLFADGVPVLAVDPHPDNGRAIAVYRKLGFAADGEPRSTEWGLALPMVRSR